MSAHVRFLPEMFMQLQQNPKHKRKHSLPTDHPGDSGKSTGALLGAPSPLLSETPRNYEQSAEPELTGSQAAGSGAGIRGRAGPGRPGHRGLGWPSDLYPGTHSALCLGAAPRPAKCPVEDGNVFDGGPKANHGEETPHVSPWGLCPKGSLSLSLWLLSSVWRSVPDS